MIDAASLVRRAEEIADGVFFPAALDTDRADRVPASHLDLLASAGFYGIAGPPDAGGFDLTASDIGAIVERLASGCVATTFVWLQHHTAVRTLASSSNQPLRETWLEALCAGRKRAGVALGGIRPGATPLRATQVEGGWLLDGSVTWVTGWGCIDTCLAAAPTEDGRIVHALIDPVETESGRVERQRLLAVNASDTVQLTFDSFFIPDSRVAKVETFVPLPAYDGGGRINGSLALGHTRRCLKLIGPSALDEKLVECRAQLDCASELKMAEARAAAAELASRASAALIVATGSSSLTLTGHAQRLAREAVFLLVFGTRPAIKRSLLTLLT